MSKKVFMVDSDKINRIKFFDDDPFYIGNDLLSEKFDEQEIPREFQKLFFCKKQDEYLIREISTNLIFVIQNEEKNKIQAIAKVKNSGEVSGANFYSLDSEKQHCSREAIKDFYMSLYKTGYLNKYLKILNQYFLTSVNIDLCKLNIK